MEAKGSEAEGQWWRWTSGSSNGSISSSSDAVRSTGDVAFTSSSSSSLSPSEASLRWQKRPAASGRAGGFFRDVDSATSPSAYTNGTWSTSSSGNSSSSSSPSGSVIGSPTTFFASSSSMMSARSARRATTAPVTSSSSSSRKKIPSSVARPTSARDAATVFGMKKKVSPSASYGSSHFTPLSSPAFGCTRPTASSSSSFAAATAEKPSASSSHAEITWSLGPSSVSSSKRKVATRKDKKVNRTPVQPRRASLYTPRAVRSVAEHGRERVAATASYVFFEKDSVTASATVSPSSRFETTSSSRSTSVDSPSPKPTRLSTSPVSSTSSSSYASSSSPYLKNNDPLVNCARAVLQDCIMKRRMERSTMRKRNIEDCVKSEFLDSKSSVYVPRKLSDCGIMSSCSSSDDELSQLSSMEHSFNSDRYDRDSECKLSKEEQYRELMLGDNGLSSSPEFERFSPFLEEKGLPVEIRYQLPLALGTASETDKECTICQTRYGIGDHIVTLPCQHFFHACCVDKWLWNHTSCPLCRTEVSLDVETEVSSSKHNFQECSELDQETIRRKMRSTSQSAGFRPVVPDLELDQLHRQLSSLSVQEANQPKYLVCPKPKRPHAK